MPAAWEQFVLAAAKLQEIDRVWTKYPKEHEWPTSSLFDNENRDKCSHEVFGAVAGG